jgi:hypothetical protein
MSIKFVCPCGKRLKARDNMAARRIMCPRCGNPVGVPSLDPNKSAPMTPAERLRAASARRPITLSHLDDTEAQKEVPSTEYPVPGTKEVKSGNARAAASDATSLKDLQRQEDRATQNSVPTAQSPAVLVSANSVRLLPAEGRPMRGSGRQKQYLSRYKWPLETHWYQCLGYPFRAWQLVFGLAAALSLLTLAGALILPRLLAEMEWDRANIGVAVVCVIGPLMIPAYVCAFLDCVLAASIAGEARYVYWPGNDLLLIVRSFAAWVLSALCVPLPLAWIGFYYWLYCGDLHLVDWIILIELGLFGAGYWLLAVLAVSCRERLRDLNPWRVAELAERLGWRTLVAALLAGLLFLGHGLLAYWTTGVLHDQLGYGLLLAASCWVSWMYWATFVFRVLGVWCYHRNIA